jgi:arylsulfatase
MRRLSLILVALFWSFFHPCPGSPVPDRPNVVIILTDDQGYGDFSCHGNPVLRTPNLDRLHAQSVRLTDFHVAPMCTPTRGQLLTGCDALRTGATSVSAGRSFLRPGFRTLAEHFAASGYKTALFGKWHLGDNAPNLPQYRGFQESVHHLGWGITSMADTWENDLFDGRFRHNGVLERFPGYCTDVWFQLARAWVEERRAKDERFFLYLPTNAPHGPHWVSANDAAPYRGKGPAEFFGMIANIDENVGRFLDLLDRTGLRSNTIVVLLNDNGGTAGVKLFNAGMRGGKTTYYEGGHRAAGFISWPGGLLGGPRDEPTLAQVQDLAPTLLDLCQVAPLPDTKFDGASLAGLLRGDEAAKAALADRALIVQYGQTPEKGQAAVMWKRWRLVHDTELHDLDTDPGQARDVSGSRPEIVQRLREHYNTWWSEVGPLVGTFVPIEIGAERENPATLSAADWADVYCDNMGQLRAGDRKSGAWHLKPARTGTYRIELSRWPLEADAPIAGGVPRFDAHVGALPAGVALPVAAVRVLVAGRERTLPVTPDARSVVIEVPLEAGEPCTLQSWMLDGDGREIAGAYFARVTYRP